MDFGTPFVFCKHNEAKQSKHVRMVSKFTILNPARELDVLRLDGHPLGVDRAEVGVLEELDEKRL